MAALQYPRWLYHETNPPVLVSTAEEAARLPKGFANSPRSQSSIPVSKVLVDLNSLRRIELHNTNPTSHTAALSSIFEHASWSE